MTDTVSKQITDAVTQANVKVLADSPALSLSNLYQTISQSLSLSVQNAVMAQQQSNLIHQAVTTQSVSLLYSVNTAAIGVATKRKLESDHTESLIALLGAIQALRNS